MHANAPTPDLIAGPLHGFGDPRDFYIDVQSPSSDYLVKPGAIPEETAQARALFAESMRTSIFRFSALDDSYVRRFLLSQLETKIRRYGGARRSPLVTVSSCRSHGKCVHLVSRTSTRHGCS